MQTYAGFRARATAAGRAARARRATRRGTTGTESSTYIPQGATLWMSVRLGDFPCTDGAHVSLFTPATVPGRTAEGFDVKRRGKLARRRTNSHCSTIRTFDGGVYGQWFPSLCVSHGHQNRKSFVVAGSSTASVAMTQTRCPKPTKCRSLCRQADVLHVQG